jgi:hypothetical protein
MNWNPETNLFWMNNLSTFKKQKFAGYFGPLSINPVLLAI